jgi:ribulose-5-phosphate 4-epimerase/fuculose-1-phosphate aldolase
MCGYMAPALVQSPSDLIEYFVDGSDNVDPNAAKGYSERFIHGELYKRFPDVKCVIHSHAEDVLPYVVSGVPMRAVYHMAGFLGRQVPVFDIAPLYKEASTAIEKQDMLVNNSHLGSGLAQKFGGEGSGPEHSVVLMRRHGFTTHADSVEKAVYRAIYTKINAKVQTDALAVSENYGGEKIFEAGDLGLTDEQVVGCTAMNERFQYVDMPTGGSNADKAQGQAVAAMAERGRKSRYLCESSELNNSLVQPGRIRHRGLSFMMPILLHNSRHYHPLECVHGIYFVFCHSSCDRRPSQ